MNYLHTSFTPITKAHWHLRAGDHLHVLHNIILFYLVLVLSPMQNHRWRTPSLHMTNPWESLKHLLHVGYCSLTTLQIHTIIYMFWVSQIVHIYIYTIPYPLRQFHSAQFHIDWIHLNIQNWSNFSIVVFGGCLILIEMPGSIVNREWHHCPWKVLKLRNLICTSFLLSTLSQLFVSKGKFYLFLGFESNLPFWFVVF
jgi:hypothetical protein